jgi:7-carboxy-7-deazaguanine synthase
MSLLPISEIFGPTIQGEGIYTGCKAVFIRFAGCDSKCEWCDTAYAKSAIGASKCSEEEIISTVRCMEAPIVVLTGGNPLLYQLGGLVDRLLLIFREVHVETQGTIWKDWLPQATFNTISPKRDALNLDVLTRMVNDRCQIKVVVFDEDDYAFARDIHLKFPHVPFIFQIGHPSDDRGRWLAERVSNDKGLGHNARVLTQLHRIFWGQKRGV